jgi:hypothetical protein
MKNIFKLICIGVLALTAFQACQTSADLDTDQFSTELAFGSFAPNPVYRGGELTIIGSFLEQVAEVRIPGIDPITDITVVEKGKKSKITVTLPNTTEEVGKISIVGKNGKVLTSKTELTYTEPIVFTDFSPKSAMPGDLITVTGDYMNLIQEVIFEGGAIATGDAIKEQGRKSLKVVVPAKAVTGKIILGDADEVADPDNIANKSYSTADLVIGDPTVSSLAIETAKPGQTLTINGAYLNMIEKVVFEGGTEVSKLTVSADNKTLTLTLPATAQSGDVNAVSFAGKSFKAGTITLVVPTGLAVAPTPVRADSTLTITGTGLELITGVDLPGASNVTFAFADDKITLTVPRSAAEGDITLKMDSGDQVTVAYTLVHPVVTAIAPTDIFAGDTIKVSGTDLDLISGVTLGGKAEEFGLVEKDIEIYTASTSVSGKIELKLDNGEVIKPGEDITVSYHSFVVVNEMPAAEHIGAAVTLKGTNFMMVDRIYIGEAKVTKYVKRADDEVSFIMPYNKIGTYPIKFELLTGEVEVCPTQIEVLLQQNISTLWEGNVDLGAWSINWEVPADAFTKIDLKVGQEIRYYVTPTDAWWQFQLFDGHWAALPVDESTDGTNNINTNKMDISAGYIHIKVTDDILTKFTTFVDWGYSGIIQGENLILTKIEVVEEVPQEKVIWEGNVDLGAWSVNWEVPSDAFTKIDLAIGDEIRYYVTPTDAWWQFQLFDGHWAALPVDESTDGTNNINTNKMDISAGYIHIKVTDDILTKFTTFTDWGYSGIIQGENVILTKITVF